MYLRLFNDTDGPWEPHAAGVRGVTISAPNFIDTEIPTDIKSVFVKVWRAPDGRQVYMIRFSKEDNDDG